MHPREIYHMVILHGLDQCSHSFKTLSITYEWNSAWIQTMMTNEWCVLYWLYFLFIVFLISFFFQI